MRLFLQFGKVNYMKNLLVSFSGGETSAFMAQWLKRHYKSFGYENILFIFANTGFENEETLLFADQCDRHFDLNLVWVEAKIIKGYRKGTRHNVTSFANAKRDAEPFEAFIAKYGIPNHANPQCTSELKERPITSYAREFFKGEKWHTAIGIRLDEADRINTNYKKNGYIYPLIDRKMIPATKPMVNLYWKNMDFRLNLKGYQGNCITCYKKSDAKLYQIAREQPKAFEFFERMEQKYGNFFPPQRAEKWQKEGKTLPKNIKFFRNHRSAKQIISESKSYQKIVRDDSKNYSIQLDLFDNNDESCEVFSNCSLS
jgi:hypothetical protein